MRKILLTTTALVAFGLTNAAVAETMSHVEKGITIPGSGKFVYHTWSDGADDMGGANNSKTETQTNLSVAYNGVTDSGLSIGVESAIALNHDGVDNGLDNDGYEFSLGGDWGSIRTGDSTAGDNYAVDGTDVLYDRFTLSAVAAGVSSTLMDDHWLNKSDHNTLTYTSPNYSGFVLGISYDDGGSASSSDTTEACFSYSTTAGGLDIELGAGLRTAGKANDDDNTSADASATSFGFTLSTDKISFTVAANDLEQDATLDTSDVDVSNTSVGISYSPSDSVKLSASYLTADDNQNDDEYSEMGASLAYTIATGLQTGITYQSMDVTVADTPNADNDGTYTTFFLKASF